ncbi:MAG: PAS domain-containing protein, partial [Halofilum sp. (in: g-proteobacteria)]
MVDPEAIWRPRAGGRAGPAPYGVLITDGPAAAVGAAPRIHQTDAGFARMTGYTAEAAQGLALDAIAGPVTDRERLATALERLATGRPDAGATVHYRRDGTPFGMAWSVEPVSIDAAEINCCVWVLQEIDVDRAATEGDRAAPSDTAIFVASARVSPDGEDRVLHVSNGFIALTGYGAEELLGRNPAMLQGDGGPTGERDRLSRALAGGWPCRVELLDHTRAGRPFWNALDLLPLRPARGG